MSKYKFFSGLPHQKIHSRFFRQLLKGDEVCHPCTVDEKDFPEAVFEQDGKDTVWFFNDVYFHLHPKIQGKQILVGHGLGLGAFMTPRRVEAVNRCFDLVFETGRTAENSRLEKRGVAPAKIKEIGYTLLFEIPDLPVEPRRVLFSSTYYRSWNHHKNLGEILRELDPSIQGVLTVHPETPPLLREPLVAICRSRPNLTYIDSQEELLAEYARCACVVGQVSSTVAPFYFFKKPVIFLHGHMSRNPFIDFGWMRIRNNFRRDPIFDRIFKESVVLSDGKHFNRSVLEKAAYAGSAREIFYPWNYDKEATVRRIQSCLEELRA